MRRMSGRSRRQPSSGQAHGTENVLERYLKLSFVTCAVAMTPAVSDNEKVRFQHP